MLVHGGDIALGTVHNADSLLGAVGLVDPIHASRHYGEEAQIGCMVHHLWHDAGNGGNDDCGIANAFNDFRGVIARIVVAGVPVWKSKFWNLTVAFFRQTIYAL